MLSSTETLNAVPVRVTPRHSAQKETSPNAPLQSDSPDLAPKETLPTAPDADKTQKKGEIRSVGASKIELYLDKLERDIRNLPASEKQYITNIHQVNEAQMDNRSWKIMSTFMGPFYQSSSCLTKFVQACLIG